MNILMVSHAYPRWEGDVAGAFVERLAVALHQRSHAMRVIAPADRGNGAGGCQRGVSVSRVRYAPGRLETLAYRGTMAEQGRGPLGALVAASLITAQARAIARLHAVQPADLVHAHWWVPGGVSAWLARLTRGPRYVITVHGTDATLLKESAIARLLGRVVLRAAAAVTAVSSYLAEQVGEYAGLDPDTIRVQPMPVDVERFQRASTGGGGIAVVGRLTKQKNIGVVLQALARLHQGGCGVSATIVGDGPERAALEARARTLGIAGSVRFTGAVSPERVPEVIGNADVMVFPAVGEGLGLVAGEALMMGIPVVAGQGGGGVTDLVPPTGAGRLVKADDPLAIADAVGELLAHPTARTLAWEAGGHLRRRLAPPAVAEAFESVYQRASAGR